MKNKENKKGIGTGAAAKILGVSRFTVWRLAVSGKLPSYRLPSGHFRVLQAGIDAIIGNNP